MSTAIHCDAAGCDAWSKSPEVHGFLALSWLDDLDDPLHFCCPDHAMAWCAARPPLAEVTA